MTEAPFLRPIAHRGLHDKERGIIENSAAAFEAAIASGFGIECDLQLTADDQAVIFHDDALDRLLGREGRTRDIDSATLGAIPLVGSAAADCAQTFSALLAQIDGRTPLVVEVKTQANAKDTAILAGKVAALASSYTGQLVIKSFDPHMLAALRRAGYRGELGIITYGYDRADWDGDMSYRQRFMLRHLLHYPFSRFTFISCERSALRLPAIRLFRSIGFKVISWTIRSRAEAQEAMGSADQIVFESFSPVAEQPQRLERLR